MEFEVLGPIAIVDDDGSVVVVRSTQQRLLLAILIAAAPRVVANDVLAEGLWRDALPADPAAALQSHISRLRRQLGPVASWIETTMTGYRIACPSDAIDASRFELLLGDARDRDDASAGVETLDRALALWRGRAYGEFSDHPAIATEAGRLEELRAEAAELHAERLLALGRALETASAMQALIGEHRFRERPVALLMRALAAAGRHPEALEAFANFRRLLDEELGLEPSPELRAIEAAILRHDHPSRSVIGVPGNSFVGRDAEVAKTTWLLERNRLVTLTGPGGVGKTRVALHVAADVATRYPDGVYLCELARVSSPSEVVGAVASTLHVEDQAGRPLVDRVVEFLHTKQALLVLDNCEHVLHAVAELITSILLRTPQVDVLATSRERLGAEGEQRVPVGPLTTPAWDDPTGPSFVLFADRSRAVRPDLEIGESDLPTVSELCRRLDGLPLAIELAAAQTVSSSPAEILDAIAHRLGDLADRRRTVERHRSLDAVFGWSYDLLAPSERLVFEQLAVFAGGWTAEAAATVAGATPKELSALVERSLIAADPTDGRTRFSMLEPVRQYAMTRLDERDGTYETQARHAAWAVAYAEAAEAGLCGPEEIDWLRGLQEEHANLRAAHRWCLEHDVSGAIRFAASLYYYIRCGASSEVFSWAEQTVRRFPDRSHPRTAAAYASAALGSALSGDLPTARVLCETAIALSVDDPTGMCRALTTLGDVENFLGGFEEALPHYDRAVELAQQSGDLNQMGIGLCDRAMSLAYLGRFDEAIEACEALVPIVQAVKNPSLSAHADYTNGEVRVDHAPLDALVFLRRSVAAARRIGDRLLLGLAGLTAVSCEGRVGDQNKALVQYGDLIDHWHRAGAWNMQWATLRTLIELLTRLGRDTEATVLYGAMTASPTAPPVAGADTVRIAEAVAALRGRLGDERFEALREEGGRLSDNEAVAFARTAVGGAPVAAGVPS